MSFKHIENATVYSQQLRKNMTPQEKKLWYQFLKKIPYVVRRQYPIDHYILDFYLPKQRIAIELDGRQHLTEEHKLADVKRDSKLQEYGISVLRYPNHLIDSDFVAVCEHIKKHIELR